MSRLLKWISNLFFPILIILITGYLAWVNYEPGTFLSGWDTLHPEFNLPLYLERAFNGVWMQHQGLGAVASQAHAGELPRLVVIWILDLLLPQNIVRYTFFFLCLTAGSLGVYFLAKYLLSIKWQKFASASSFLASLFYIFNLTTVQQFYVPLEMFAVHYAALPWLFYLAIKFIREGRKKDLIWFSVITLFSSSMAHTPTLFYVYMACLAVFLLILNFKKGILLVFLTVLLNSFWILPNLYYIKNHSGEVESSKIHRIFSGEAFLQSKAFGNIESLVLSKNFLFNWREFDNTQNTFVDLLDEWETHLGKPYVKEVGYILFGLAFFGFFVSVFTKSRYSVAFLPIFLLAVFFWLNSNPPFGNTFDFLRGFNLFRESLRFPFTKFSIILVMILSIWFSFTSRFIFGLFEKFKLGFVYLLVAVLAIFYFQMPSLQGYLVSPSMKVKIPNEYFEMFDWFGKRDKSARVAKLPLQTFWGWNFYDWDYEGAGFTWFGIPQPTLDREFDRWSKYNETFYDEASYALYSGSKEAFEQVLQKYQVKYLLLDESIINAGGDQKVLFIPEIKKMISDLGYTQVFQSGFLSVYDTHVDTEDVSATRQEFASILPSVSAPKDIILSESFGEGRGFAEAYNCDLKKLGSVQKVRLAGGILYRAEGSGVSCDYFNYPGLSHNQAYILRIKGENRQGRSLKIYLQNWRTNRMDLEELLPEGKFDKSFVIYPNGEGEGYSLNLETRSFGRIAAENVIESIEFYNADYTFSPGPTFIENNLKIKDVKKYGTWLYKIDIQGNGLIELGQGYEEGWLGIVRDGQSWSKLEHVRVNSWANGWFINDQGLMVNGQKLDLSHQPLTIIVFFWPQLLEYLGFVVLVGTLALAAKSNY